MLAYSVGFAYSFTMTEATYTVAWNGPDGDVVQFQARDLPQLLLMMKLGCYPDQHHDFTLDEAHHDELARIAHTVTCWPVGAYYIDELHEHPAGADLGTLTMPTFHFVRRAAGDAMHALVAGGWHE